MPPTPKITWRTHVKTMATALTKIAAELSRIRLVMERQEAGKMALDRDQRESSAGSDE